LGLNLGYQTGLKETYPEDNPQDLGIFLKGIPRDKVLLVVSSLLNQKEIYSKNLRDILGIWFRASNNDFANNAYQRLLTIQRRVGQPVIIITQPSVLSVFAYANNNLTNEQTQTEEEIEINLFKAFLFQNEIFNRVEEKITETTEILNKDIRLYALQFTNSVRFSDVVNFDLGEIFFSEFIRAILFFEFLEKRDDAKLLLQKFIEKYEVTDWKDYLKRISGISFLILKKERDGYLELDIPRDASFDSNIKFLDTLATVKYDELSDFDFKVIRERPLHKIEDGKYRVISELFAVERIFKGLYFNLKAINEILPNEQKIKDFRFLYTFHFSEKHSLYRILRKTFPKKLISFSGEDLEKKGVNGAPDYYIRNNNKLFIFESKDSLINASLKESGDFSLLEPDIKKKFYVDNDGAKAVVQLLNFIETIYSNLFRKIDTGYKSETLRVYPIIIIHDRQLDVPGFNKILNYWFTIEAKKNEKRIPLDRIHPITVIDISTLILTHELILDRRLIIEELIDQYHDFVKIKAPENFRTEHQYKKHLLNTGLPFSFFIKQQISKKNLPRSPHKMIREKAIIALEEINLEL
jgi:hypothetical protein